MNTKMYQEIEQMIVSARGMNEDEFDRMADERFSRISEEEKDEYCQALAAFHADRICQYMEVNKEIAVLQKLNGVETLHTLLSLREHIKSDELKIA